MSTKIIFLVFQILNIISTSFIIQFKRFLSIKTESNNMNLEEFIDQRINNIYETDLYLGEPPQKIPGFLKSYEYKFLLSNNYCPKKEYYYKDKSKTLSYENSENNYYVGIRIMDSFIFNSTNNNQININNFSFIADNDIKTPQCFHIGTQLLIKSDEKETNIMDILHKNKLIKSYFYTYKIINDDELYLILDLNIDINNINYKFIKPLINKFYPNSPINYKWGLTFENIILNNYNYHYKENIKAAFDINYGCLLASSDFKEKFEKYLKDNEIYIEEQYVQRENYIYFFDKSIKGIEKLKNIKLIFYNRELNYNFTLNYNDLFLEKKNGFYFLVIFDYKTREEWKLGFPFFKKYNFIYNHDAKLLGFINQNKILNDKIDDILNNNNNNTKIKISNNFYNDKNFIKIILIIIFGLIALIIVILFFGVLIGKKIFGVRKTKVNELLELYDYSAKNNEKNIQI